MSGLTPSDALRAATFEAAAALGHEKDLGAIGEGKLADLVIVRADPRLSIANMAQIEAVVLRGQFLDRTKLNTMLDEVAAEAEKEKKPARPAPETQPILRTVSQRLLLTSFA